MRSGGGGLWLVTTVTRESGDLCRGPAGGMQRSVSDRPSYLHLWHEFLNIQPKRFPREYPVSETFRACTFLVRVNFTIHELNVVSKRLFIFLFFIHRFRGKKTLEIIDILTSNSLEEFYMKDESNNL